MLPCLPIMRSRACERLVEKISMAMAMATKKRFYLTTPIYYVNDKPHIGHAYTSLASDVVVRYKRLRGYKCHLLTGTDEHGQKVQQAARRAGEETTLFTDRFAENFRSMAERLQISYDGFVRTTEDRHRVSAQAFWARLQASGDLYDKDYEGWYSVRDENYCDISELVERADGTKVSASGGEVEWVVEPSIFFRLSKYRDALLRHYDAHPDFILPRARMNEVRSFVEGKLWDLCVSRTSFSWGVPVPEREGHVMYVWVDALTNYLTGVGFPDEEDQLFDCWPADMHMVGKDIVRFHGVYWPALLMSAGLPLPKRIFAHGWWTNEGEKISKSVGNVIDPLALVDSYGLDRVRYFLLREVPFGEDGDFSHAAMVRRSNEDLANGLGNLCMRVLTLAKRGWGGLPVCEGEVLRKEDEDLLAKFDAGEAALEEWMAVCSFHRALAGVMALLGDADRYITREAPWKLLGAGDEVSKRRAGVVLWVLCECLRMAAIDLLCFMPGSMGRILEMLGVEEGEHDFAHRPKKLPRGGGKLGEVAAVFPRLEKRGEG